RSTGVRMFSSAARQSLSGVSGNLPSVSSMPDPLPDHVAVDPAPQGADVPSWEQIVTDHSARVYRLAYRLTGNGHDAEDLTQEVFVRVFRSLHTYRPGTMEGWLHRITTNLFLDQARRKQRIRFDALSDEAAGRLPSALPTPDVAQMDRLFDADVEAALASLAPDFRAAVVLCDVEGLTYEEIADVLGLKLGTVRSRIHRGRAQLRAALAHRAPRAGRTRFAGPRVGGLAGQLQ
ncbi:MAG: polymerase, sigma 29 subunit, SigE, partial [Marmoricola sp.]|nr:polymerase, sigma 29 subunit, SigE [Marmoricola sp.]